MKIWKTVALAAAAALPLASAAHAADIIAAQPAAAIAPLPDESFSHWQIRVRALTVLPMSHGSVRAGRVEALNATPGMINANGLRFSGSEIPELDISYFFTKNIAAELILGTTYSKIYGRRGKGGDLFNKTLGLPGKRLGKTWILPPTLTLQYHFTNFGKFQPYIGGGVNYTFFYSETSSRYLRNLTVDGAWGGAAQVGFDYMFTKHWGLNFDVKKIWLAPSYHGHLGPHYAKGIEGTKVSGRARIDPWLIGAGVTYRF